VIDPILRDLFKIRASRGLLYAISGIEITRCAEYPYLITRLACEVGEKVLDIGTGSASVLPLYLCRKGVNVHLTDIDPYIVTQRRNMIRAGLGRQIGKTCFIALQDATRLGYACNSFDKVVACSSIEHIPNEGDCLAMREISRVLRLGGKAVVTVPYDAESFVVRQHAVHGIERVYNDVAVNDRIVEPSGLDLRSVEYFGFVRGSLGVLGHLIQSLPNIPRYVIGWMNIIIAPLVYGTSSRKQANNVGLVFQKKVDRLER